MSLFQKVKLNEAVSAVFPSVAPRQFNATHSTAQHLPAQRAANLNTVWSELNPRSSTPVKPEVARAGRLIAALPTAPLYERYTVSHREDLDVVASRYPGVSPAEIAAANQLKHFRLEAGQSLVIPGPALRTQPKFQKAVRYYNSEYNRYSRLYGAPDDTLLQARQKDIGLKVTQANYQNVITDQGIGLKSTQIHVDENAARLQKRLEAQLNQELIDKAETDKAEANRAEADAIETSKAKVGKRRSQETRLGNNTATLRPQPNLGNTADGRLAPMRIELDADKDKEQRWAAYEYEKTAYSLGATDKGMWGNLWEATTSRYSASLSATKEALGEVTGNVALQREAAVARMNAQHRSNLASQRAQLQGAVDDYRQIQTGADLGKYMGGLALGTLPYMGEIALGAVTGGTSMGLRATATALQGMRARMAGGFVASYPSGVGGLAVAQHEQGTGHNAWAAFGLGVPFSAANLFGVEGMAARLSLARNSIAWLDDMSGAKGAATRATATTAVMGFSEMSTEVGQTFIERYGQLQTDISQAFFSEDFKHELPNVMVGGALLGGTLGGGLGGWRRRALPTATQAQSEKVDVPETLDIARHSTGVVAGHSHSWLPVGGPVVNRMLKVYLPQAIAMPIDPEGMGRAQNPRPSSSDEISDQHVKSVTDQVHEKEISDLAAARTAQDLQPEVTEDLESKKQALLVAKTLLEAEPGVLEELVVQLQQREARAAEGAESPSIAKSKARNAEHYRKLKSMARVKGVRTDLVSWLQPVLKPGESARESIELLIAQPEIWGQGRAHLPQVDPSIRAIEQLEAVGFKVLEGLVDGLSFAEIAQHMKVNRSHVVTWHLPKILQALGLLSWPDVSKRYPGGLEALTLKVRRLKLHRLTEGAAIGSTALEKVHPTALLVLADLLSGLDRITIGKNRKLSQQGLRDVFSKGFGELGVKNIQQLVDRYVGKDLYGDLQAEYARRVISEHSKVSQGGNRWRKLDREKLPPSQVQGVVRAIWAKSSNRERLPYLISYLKNEAPLLKEASYQRRQLRAIETLARQLNVAVKELHSFLAKTFGTRRKPNGLNEAIESLQQFVPTRADLGLPVNRLQANNRIVTILLDGRHAYFSQLYLLVQGSSLAEVARAHFTSENTVKRNKQRLLLLLGARVVPKGFTAVDLIAEAMRPSILSGGTFVELLQRIVEKPKEWVRGTGLIRSIHPWTVYKKLTSDEQVLLRQYAMHEYDLPILAAALNKNEKIIERELLVILNKLGQSGIESLKFSYVGDLRDLDQHMVVYAERALQAASVSLEESSERKKNNKHGRVGRAQDFAPSYEAWWAPEEPAVEKVRLDPVSSLGERGAEEVNAAPTLTGRTATVGSLGSAIDWLLGLKNGLKQNADVGRGRVESIARKLLLTDGEILREALIYLKYLEINSEERSERHYGSSSRRARLGLLRMAHGAYGNMAELDGLLRSVAVGSETPEQVITSLLENRHEWRKARGYLRQINMDALGSLSDREVEVLGFVVHGLKDRQIASQLSISWVTIKEYRQSAFKKLGFYNYKDIRDNYGLLRFEAEVDIEILRRGRSLYRYRRIDGG